MISNHLLAGAGLGRRRDAALRRWVMLLLESVQLNAEPLMLGGIARW